MANLLCFAGFALLLVFQVVLLDAQPSNSVRLGDQSLPRRERANLPMENSVPREPMEAVVLKRRDRESSVLVKRSGVRNLFEKLPRKLSQNNVPTFARHGDGELGEIATPLNLSGNAVTPMNLSGNGTPLNFSGNSVSPLSYSEDTAAPMNFSGNTIGPMNFSGNTVPTNLSGNTVTPMNLSGDSIRPMNFSGNSAQDSSAERFKAKPNEDRVLSSGGLSLYVIVNMTPRNIIRMRCSANSDQSLTVFYKEFFASGERANWDLETVKPIYGYEKYTCAWSSEGTKTVKRLTTEFWVQLEGHFLLPFICTECIFTLNEDGLYLYSTNVHHLVKLQDWLD